MNKVEKRLEVGKIYPIIFKQVRDLDVFTSKKYNTRIIPNNKCEGNRLLLPYVKDGSQWQCKVAKITKNAKGEQIAIVDLVKLHKTEDEVKEYFKLTEYKAEKAKKALADLVAKYSK